MSSLLREIFERCKRAHKPFMRPRTIFGQPFSEGHEVDSAMKVMPLLTVDPIKFARQFWHTDLWISFEIMFSWRLLFLKFLFLVGGRNPYFWKPSLNTTLSSYTNRYYLNLSLTLALHMGVDSENFYSQINFMLTRTMSHVKRRDNRLWSIALMT